MSQKVQDLFGEGDTQVQPRSRMIVALLSAGMLLAMLGLACSSVPGGVLVLWAWILMEKEIDRVDSGYLPEDSLPKLRLLKGFVWASLTIILILFIAQTYLLFSGFYLVFWGSIIQSLNGAPVISG